MSAKRRQFIISEAKLTPKFCSDSILTKSFIRTEKSVGDRTHPCCSPPNYQTNEKNDHIIFYSINCENIENINTELH
jgi:hypothetical protein